mgnify:CR=1 FL=1
MEDSEYDEFVELMFKVYRTLHDGAFDAEARADGLICHETRILGCLSCFGRMSPSKIADLLGFSRPQMSILADGLVERKLIERKRDEADRRIVWLRITPAGQAALREAIAMTGLRVKTLLSPIPTAEIKGMKATLERLAVSLGREGA